MSHIRIDKSKAVKKWSPVLENMGVAEDRVEWMSEMAEYHSINENAYVNATNVAGMGGILNPTVGTLAGNPGNYSNAFGNVAGSGDVGQNLLPVAMKIAAQTIGLDLVAVKPTPGPKIDLLYIDFQYDDVNLASNERPQVFKLRTGDDEAIAAGITASLLAANISQTQGGLTGQIFFSIGTASQAGYTATYYTAAQVAVNTFPNGSSTGKANIVEFLGFSRIDGLPMFRAFRQANTAGQANYFAFNQTLNTFDASTAMNAQILMIKGVAVTAVAGSSYASVELVSALEDHIPGFSANWTAGNGGASGNYPMGRQADDDSYSGVIGPKISSKTVAVGTIEVSSALRRTEIEDIKANTGMDIVQKMESILVNELSQTISKQIVSKIFEMGALNATTAPTSTAGGAAVTIFDLDTAYATSGLGGETTHAVQRKLITKIAHASNYIATEGRVGPAQYLITNGGLAAALQDIAGYTINPVKSKLNGQGQLYPVGSIGDISIYVDPYMRYNDNRIVLGRKNNPDQPGIIFVPYLMAQSISVISEATFAPRMLLRSRYAVTEVGWYPHKQYMTITVTDAKQYLN